MALVCPCCQCAAELAHDHLFCPSCECFVGTTRREWAKRWSFATRGMVKAVAISFGGSIPTTSSQDGVVAVFDSPDLVAAANGTLRRAAALEAEGRFEEAAGFYDRLGLDKMRTRVLAAKTQRSP